MIRSTRDVVNLAFWKTELTWNETCESGTFHYTTTKLILLPASPGEDVALNVTCENVIATSSKKGDFLQLRKLNWCTLNMDLLSETKDAIVALKIDQ
jgi:hypothetical protein